MNDVTSTDSTPNEEVLEQLRDLLLGQLSKEAVATIIALLQPVLFRKPTDHRAIVAVDEVAWFTGFLTDMIGIEECNLLFDELCL